MSEQTRVPRGLSGVSVTDTGIAKSDADGSLIYRGYTISDLAENASFEETAHLILYGDLPDRTQLASFSHELRSRMKVDQGLYRVIRDLPMDAHPIDVLRTAVSALGSLESGLDQAGRQLSAAAKIATLVANSYRIKTGMKLVEPDSSLNFPENLLYMILGEKPESSDAWTFERELIFYMEHDLNASSFTVRVVASTLADIYSALTAGLAALKGPLHGGANEAAMEMLLEVREPSAVAAYVADALSSGRKIPGFGHRIYKQFDPRARLSKQYLKETLMKKKIDDKLFRLCDALEREMWERKKIPANLDFYAAPLFFTLGIPIPLYTPIFAASRVFGWTAHYNEQLLENKLIRPEATYVGPKGLKYRPVGER
jgi:2-methylcitrate synthase